MSEPDWRAMGDPLNDRLPPHPTWRSRRQWLEAGAPNIPVHDDPDWDFLVNEIDGMWAEIDALRSALRHLNEWCPSSAPRQAEIDRLLEAPAMSKRSLLQLRARFEMSSNDRFPPRPSPPLRSLVDSIGYALCANDESENPDYGNDHLARLIADQVHADGHIFGTFCTNCRRSHPVDTLCASRTAATMDQLVVDE